MPVTGEFPSRASRPLPVAAPTPATRAGDRAARCIAALAGRARIAASAQLILTVVAVPALAGRIDPTLLAAFVAA
ncbi:MAG: hypothetical protein R3286_20335, partial [Gammaproteobacteria bacterium]|nr:hypothetical protein [Gammaproteobacteria bacterium]